MPYMYGGTILLVNLSESKVSREPTSSYSGEYLGGRGINSKLLYDGVPPEIEAFDPASLVIFGVGPLSGTPIPAGRVEVTAKSPETSFWGSSNFGGFFGPELKFAGYDNISITGKAEKPVYLWIYNDQVEIRDATHLWGKDTYETQEILRSEVDPESKIVCIGQAGENLIHFATVQHELGHGGGRTGMGAVMGSKNLKAIVIRGTKGVTLADPQKYLSIAGELQRELQNHPGIQLFQKYGLSRLQSIIGQDSEKYRSLSPFDIVMKYKPRKAGCFGCPAQCMDLYEVEMKGGGVISCALYAGPLVAGSSDTELNVECGLLSQRYGVDTQSAFGIIAWLMELYEKGIITAKDTDGIPMEWGNKEAILSILKKMVNREGFGDVLADGIVQAAERIGRGAIDHAPQVKGLSTHYLHHSAHSKGTALGVGIGARGDKMKSSVLGYEGAIENIPFLYDEKTGAEYTAVTRQKVKEITGTEKAAIPEEYEGKPALVAYAEDEIIICDSLSTCKLIGIGYWAIRTFNNEYRAALFSAGSGVETSVNTLFSFAKRIRNLERAYNVRQGITREADSLPKKFMDKPIEKTGNEDEILDSAEFEKMKSEYYSLRGWDVTTGIPTRKTLEQTGLGDIAKDLEKRGNLPGKSSEGK